MSEETPKLSKETSTEVRRHLRRKTLTAKDLERLNRLCQDTLPDVDLARLVRLRAVPPFERRLEAVTILGPYLMEEDDPHGREMFELAMSLGSDSEGDS